MRPVTEKTKKQVRDLLGGMTFRRFCQKWWVSPQVGSVKIYRMKEQGLLPATFTARQLPIGIGKGGLIKVAFYLKENQVRKLEKLRLKLLTEGKKKGKSELIRKAINLFLKHYS